jgi:hypothetical protein
LVTTIRVVSRTNRFTAKGNMLKGVSISLVRARCRPKLHKTTISMQGTELGMRSIRPETQEGFKGKGFRSNMGKDVKGMSGDNVREGRDYSDAVSGIRYFKEGSVIGGEGRRRKSRGRVRS